MTKNPIRLICLLICAAMVLSSCAGNDSETPSSAATETAQVSETTESTEEPVTESIETDDIKEIDEIVLLELEASFQYFWNETNIDENSAGYGITRDNTQSHMANYGSIAASGYAMAAYAIGAEYGFTDRDEAEKRAVKTLETYYNTVSHVNGFFYHFVKLSDGQRYGNCEVSGIDTALFLCGAVVAAEYFGGEVKELYQKIYDRVNWEWLRKSSNNRFYMAYDENGNGKHTGEWDTYAEQFIMYILGAGSDTYPVDGSIFYAYSRWNAVYGDYKYIRSWANSLFVYQFSHAYIDFRNTKDKLGVDWFENSVSATMAARQYCIDNLENSKTYSENSWGLTASANEGGYEGMYGAKPNGMPNGASVSKNDGTIALYGAVASIAFAPQEAIDAMKNYYSYGKLWGKYGFVDCYNLDTEYYSTVYLGIDKGISLLMLSNYKDGFVWKYFMQNSNVKNGLQNCEIQ